MRQLACTLAAVLLAAAAAPAGAGTISGLGDPADAVSGTQLTFDLPNQTFSSQVFGDVTISGVGGDLRIDNAFAGQLNATGTAYMDNNQGLTPEFDFDFATPTNAFAFNFGASDVNWTLTASDSSSNVLGSLVIAPTHSSNAGEYFGVSSPGISHVSLVSSDAAQEDWVFVDRFTYAGATSAVPEPAAWALMIVGFGLAGPALRRRRGAFAG